MSAETLADILAEMRDADGDFTDREVVDYADRIEAAAERERNAHINDIHNALYAATRLPGNAAAMRAALKKIVRIAEEWDTPGIHAVQATLYRILEAARAALAAPPRNCDVGTAEEQYRRFRDVCDSKDARQCSCCQLRGLNSLNCSRDKCLARWAQLPYEGGAK